MGKVQLRPLWHEKLQSSNAEERESLLQCTDPHRQPEAGEGKKKCTKNSSDRVKNESKVKHSSICQNKITASPLKRKKAHGSARTF